MELGLHILKCPTGRYKYVGSIPVALGAQAPATADDVMGGRAFTNLSGALVTWKFPLFDSFDAAKAHAASCGHPLTCICCHE